MAHAGRALFSGVGASGRPRSRTRPLGPSNRIGEVAGPPVSSGVAATPAHPRIRRVECSDGIRPDRDASTDPSNGARPGSAFFRHPAIQPFSDRARRNARRRTAAKRSAPARSLQGVSGENGAATDRYTLGVGGKPPLVQRQLTTFCATYPHDSSAALTASGQCPTLARY